MQLTRSNDLARVPAISKPVWSTQKQSPVIGLHWIGSKSPVESQLGSAMSFSLSSRALALLTVSTLARSQAASNQWHLNHFILEVITFKTELCSPILVP